MWTDCSTSSTIRTCRCKSSLQARRIPGRTGKQLIQQVYRQVRRAETSGRLVFLEDYDMNLARYLVQGVDVWMNTPSSDGSKRHLRDEGRAQRCVEFFRVGAVAEAFNGKNGWAIGEDKDIDAPEAAGS